MRGSRGVPLLRLILVVALLVGSCGSAEPDQQAVPTSIGSTADVEGPSGSAAAPPTTGDSGQSTGPSSGYGDAGFAVAPAKWAPCGAGLDCATVAVPLDHEDPAGTTIDLALVRVPAGDPARRLGSLFVNPGGPGASGVDTVSGGFRLDDDTMAIYDLVGFDPRGIGGSDPLACEPDLTSSPLPDPEPDTPAEAQQLEQLARSVAQRCAETDGDRLAHLDTYDVARDLELLRRAVGDEHLTYYGLSYGTLIGLRYLELFPKAAGRMVLDGVVDPTATLEDLLRQQAAAFERSFADMAADCVAAPDCPPGGLQAAYDRAMATLEAAPVGGAGPAELATAAIMSTYSPSIWPVFRQGLAAALVDGDFTTIEQLSDRYFTSISFAAYAAVSCTDTPVPAGPAGWDDLVADLAGISPRFGAATGNELRTCAHWPVRTDEAPRPVTAEGTEPVVVIGTSGDAATPLENAVAVTEQLAEGHLLVHDAQGHTAHGDPCVDAVVRSYLVDGHVPAPGSRC